MKYKKINITPMGKASAKEGTKTLRAVRKACFIVKDNFSSSTNNMADLWIQGETQKKRQKTKMFKDQSVAMLKNIGTDLKKSFKGITTKGVICDISFELGGVLKKTKETYHEYMDDIKRIPHGK